MSTIDLSEAVEAAAKAVLGALPIDPDDDTVVVGFSPGGAPLWSHPEPLARAIAQAALDAALPVIERAVRQKVAQEIEAAEPKGTGERYMLSHDEAAAIARGGSQ